MPRRYSIPETVWNSYEIRNAPENIDEILHSKYSGNIWWMLEDYPEMFIELSEPCHDFIHSDYEKSELD